MKALVGEKKVSIAGREYVLRPSFEALCEIEALTGKLTLEIITRANVGLRLLEIRAILFACMKAGPNQAPLPTLEELGELILKDRYTRFTQPCLQLLVDALTPDELPSAQKKSKRGKEGQNASTGAATSG